MSAQFAMASTIQDVVEGHPDGRGLLFEHGYDVGSGFVDVLSQQQSLLDAERGGRLRDVPRLLGRLNRDSASAA
ncbi:MAG: hypothetical protein WAM30_10850 [Candidatus Dormiibacterota bacterium]